MIETTKATVFLFTRGTDDDTRHNSELRQPPPDPLFGCLLPLRFISRRLSIKTFENEQAGEKAERTVNAVADYVDALPLRQVLTDFSRLAKAAEPVELQRLMRTMIRRMEWRPDGSHTVEFYALPTTQKAISQSDMASGSSNQTDDDWLERNVRFGGPLRRTFEPVIYRLRFVVDNLMPTLDIVSPMQSGNSFK